MGISGSCFPSYFDGFIMLSECIGDVQVYYCVILVLGGFGLLPVVALSRWCASRHERHSVGIRFGHEMTAIVGMILNWGILQ
jgi:hypothetical protein